MVYKLDKDEDEDDLSCHSISSESYGDNSIVVADKPPASPVGKKTAFPCIPGEVLQIMQDHLNANASKNNIDLSSYKTLRSMFCKLIECRGIFVKLAKELDVMMKIAGDGE